jgi:transposase
MANAKIWEQRIAAWRASGLTAAQYCAKEGLGRRALSRWSQRLQGEPPPMRLARLVRTPEPAAAPTGSASPALVIEVGGARVTVGYGADISTVVTVLALVGAGSAR